MKPTGTPAMHARVLPLLGLASLGLLAATPAGAALVARWTFDRAPAGATIPDDSGAFAATVQNASGKAGIVTDAGRQAFSLPGTAPGDALTLGEGPAFDLPRAFTLEAWFRAHAAPAGSYVMILGKRYSHQYQLSWTPNGDHTIEFYVGGGDLVANRCWKDHLPVDRWLHVVAVFDSTRPTGPTQWLYVNGDLARDVRNEARLPADQGPVRLGQNALMNLAGGVPAEWDEVAIYDHPWSPAEVATAYASKAPPAARAQSWVLTGEAGEWRRVGGETAGVAERDGLSGVVQRGAGSETGRGSLSGGQGQWRFTLAGDPPRALSAGWRRPVEPPLAGAGFRLASLRYRARGLQRSGTPLPVLSLEGSQGRTPVLTSSHLVLDGLSHAVTAAVTLQGTLDAVAVDLRTEGTAAELVIEHLELGADPAPVPWPTLAAMPDGCVALALPAGPRRDLAALQRAALAGRGAAVHHPCALATGGLRVVDGLAFDTPADGAALWSEDTATPQNEALVEAFGTQVQRASYLPVARDDTLTVEVGRPVAEVFLLLVTDLPALEKQYCQPDVPCVVRDVEAVSVDLVYADGTVETTFPWSARDGGYRILGLAGAYVLAADADRALQRVVLHNRMYGRTAGLAAVTANTGPRKFPDLVAEPHVEQQFTALPVRPTPAGVALAGSIATIHSGAGFALVLDGRDGFLVRELRHEALPGLTLWPGQDSGLEVRCGDRVLTGRDVRVAAAAVRERTLHLRLSCRDPEVPLEFDLVFRPEGEAGIAAALTARNRGPTDRRADIRFPCLRQLQWGPPAETWVFFPQYRNLLTNRDVFCRQPNHRGFLVQFMDVYSPAAGGGLCLLTRNRSQEPVQYSLSKTDGAVMAAIENEGEDFPLAPGAEVTFCERVLALHAGDWHAGAELYRRWLSGWYRPVHSQDKDWFRRAAWIRSHITSATIARQISRVPALYDAASRQWRVDEFLAADRALLGLDPDILHFYVWAFDDSRQGDTARSGDYGGRDYDNLGGLESFRNAIARLQGPLRKPVSLYTIWDRYTPGTAFHQEFGDRFARVSAAGQKLADADLISISPGVPRWRTYAQQTLARLQQETGAAILYLDVFGTDDRARCLNPDAGHDHLPNWVAEDDRRFLEALRESLPATTVLWGEFPVPDVASQYWDGFLAYDGIPLHAYMAQAQDRLETAGTWSEHTLPPNVVRALFPHLRQIVFPVGTEGATSNWRYLKFLLFNGQGLFDTTWRLYDGPCRERLGRVLQIQRTYAESFDSPQPQVLVPTLRAQVFANCFPGPRQTVWTLFNGRYRPVRGEVLAVPHRRGAHYLDAWKGTALTPTVRDGTAILSLDLPPQGIGCVVQATE